MLERLRRWLFGPPKDLKDPSLFREISLLPFLAWIGLGADGLSSSAFGPDESYRSVGSHTYLAIYLGLATALTVFVISYAYSRIIEHFPHGGGGYVVASKLLGHRAGVVSGCALIVDYVLTIATSIASGSDAIFSFLPIAWQPGKLLVDALVIVFLVLINLRGIRESIQAVMPIFVVFLICHVIFLGYGLAARLGELGPVVHEVAQGTRHDLHTLGFFGLLLLFMRAYSMGGGTYTGIEAVSNGLAAMREPKVENAKRTMVYLSTSLAITAGGILLVYQLTHAAAVEGQTMNAVALATLFERFHLGPLAVGRGFIVLTLVTEGALLFAAGQTGFIDGPRVIANMALDSWFPRSFASLSDRLTMRNGVLVIGLSSLALVLFTRGSVDALVVMYSINVFITFSLSELGMVRFWVRHRAERPEWRKHLAIHGLGLVMCATILIVTILEKFTAGGWLTLVITGCLVGLCFYIRGDYLGAAKRLRRLNQILANLPLGEGEGAPAIDPAQPTAILVVREYDGLGAHTLLNVQRSFPNHFKNFIFVCTGILDSAAFKGKDQVEHLEAATAGIVDRYVKLAHKLGLAAEGRHRTGTDPAADTSALVLETAAAFNQAVCFGGFLLFEKERWFDRLLYSRGPLALQREIQFGGVPMVLLPARILADNPYQDKMDPSPG